MFFSYACPLINVNMESWMMAKAELPSYKLLYWFYPTPFSAPCKSSVPCFSPSKNRPGRDGISYLVEQIIVNNIHQNSQAFCITHQTYFIFPWCIRFKKGLYILIKFSQTTRSMFLRYDTVTKLFPFLIMPNFSKYLSKFLDSFFKATHLEKLP